MKLEFEDWLLSQKISQTADSLFHEAITCYKASAYRASLLLSYVGFQTVVKDRILLATCPTGISQAQWTNIRKNLIDDDKWDSQAFDAVQTTKPSSIFGLSDDIRHQVVYWKNRRNDCAHSKQNEINNSHVESFWLFLKSNLAKFVVSGSKEGLLNEIRNHFDFSITPPGADCFHLVEQIPVAISVSDLADFFDEIYKMFRPGTSGYPLPPPMATSEMDFWNKVLSLKDSGVVSKMIEYAKTKHRLVTDILRNHSDKIHYFTGDATFIRKLWYELLFDDQTARDFSVYCALLRNKLIPDNQIAEAHNKILSRSHGAPVEEDCITTFIATGFFDAFRQEAFANHSLSIFDWANRNSQLTKLYLERFPIDDEIATALQRIFEYENHPWSVASELDGLFSYNAAKKKEILDAFSRLQIASPRFIPSLNS